MMLTRTAMILAAVMTLTATPSLAQTYYHYHGYGYGHGALPHQSGAPATVSPQGGDRAPVTGGGY